MKLQRFSVFGLIGLLFASAVANAAKPHIVLIYTDDQGYGDASCLNPQAKFQTPHLDRLAREGISFTDAHSSDTVCTPSRYGLLTGRYSWRTKLKRGVFGAERECLIADGRMTIASLLRDHGYHTGMVGKWHLGMDFPGEQGNRDWTQPVTDMPLDKGFQYYYGIPASMNYGVLAWFEGRHAAVPPTLYTAKKPNAIAISDYRIRPPYENSPSDTKQKLGTLGMEVASDFVDSQCLTRFTDKAIAWMKKHIETETSQPFFLYLPYTSPHKPVIPLAEFQGQGNAGGYGEFMIETDHHVGRVLAFLDERGLADDTLILFTSDNGPENTWRRRKEKFQHRSNHIYKEGKRSVYEGGHRVPFLVRWPNGIEDAGRRVDDCVCQTDVLATVAELLDVQLPNDAGEDSQSLLPLLLGQEPPTREPTIHHAANGRFAIRDGNWKLVMPHQASAYELYNLSDDVAETNNVAAKNPRIVQELTEKITYLVCQGRVTKGQAQENDTPYWGDLAWLSEQEYTQRTAK